MAQKRHFEAKSENRDEYGLCLRKRLGLELAMARIRTVVFFDVIVCFMMFLRNVFSAQCRRPIKAVGLSQNKLAMMMQPHLEFFISDKEGTKVYCMVYHSTPSSQGNPSSN